MRSAWRRLSLRICVVRAVAPRARVSVSGYFGAVSCSCVPFASRCVRVRSVSARAAPVHNTSPRKANSQMGNPAKDARSATRKQSERQERTGHRSHAHTRRQPHARRQKAHRHAERRRSTRPHQLGTKRRSQHEKGEQPHGQRHAHNVKQSERQEPDRRKTTPRRTHWPSARVHHEPPQAHSHTDKRGSVGA